MIAGPARGRLQRARAGTRALCPLLALLACARQEAPRGGEPDRTPPAVTSVRPEPLSTVEALEDAIRIEFNETISERPLSGLMSEAVVLSPETPGAQVRHRGDAIEISLPGGVRPGTVYRVTVLPVVRDLFGNTMREPFEFVFSTGAELTPSAVVGLVVDRVTGRPTRDVLVHAADSAAAADPPVLHVARTDSAGVYVLRYLPPATYSVLGFLDRNRTREADPTEVQGGVTLRVGPADTLFTEANFALLEPDTTPATLVRAEVPEPSLIRVTFADYLDPEASLATVGATVERVDGEPGAPTILQLIHEHRLIALRRAEAEVRDSVAAVLDSVARAAPDTAAAADTISAAAPARAAPPLVFVGRAQGTDSLSLGILGLTLPSRVVYAELSDSLLFSVDYVLRVQGIRNLAGLTAGVDTVRVSRGAPPDTVPPPRERR